VFVDMTSMPLDRASIAPLARRSMKKCPDSRHRSVRNA
jgi:hypothetical protein